MDLLKEWLIPTVARELSAAVQWRERTPTHIRLSDNGQYEDDGSNLRARSSKPGVVQITKLVTDSEPIEAWISDSTTRLKAIMATSAVQKFFAESKKRVNKDILGGLIQILDFEVVATHLGPRDSRLTLLINEFTSLGSEGSSTFGRSPRPMEVHQGIKKLSERLEGFRAKEYPESQPPKHLDDSGRDSIVTSQNDFELSSDDSPIASQQALATQAQLNHPLENIEKGRDPPMQQNSAPFPAHVAGVKSSSPVQKPPKTPLDMNTGSSNIEISQKAVSGTKVLGHPLEKSSRATANEVKKPKNVAGLLSLLPTLLPQGHLIKSMAHPKLISKNVVTSEKSVPDSKLNPQRQEDVSESPNMVEENNGGSVAVEPGALPKEKENPPQAERNISASPNDNGNSVGTIDGLKESANIENDGSALTQVSSRISEREVRISKDQQDLLDRSDSWIPAAPGQTAPVANVPIEVLKIINHVAESRADRLTKRAQRREEELNKIQSRHSPVISESVNDSKSESDPPTSISWSLSPPNIREQLPPDSSMEVPEQLDDFQEETEDEAFQLEKRSMSVSSNSATSVRRNPARASKDPKRPAKVRPSPVSASRARESRSYICSINGCQKSYKSHHNLRYHIEKYHGGAGSSQPMSCTDTIDSEISPKATLNWFACSKCEQRFNTPGDVLQHEKKSQCSLEPLETLTTAEAVLITADDSSRHQEADINVGPTPMEHQISNSPGMQLSETGPLEESPLVDTRTKLAKPNDEQTNTIRSLDSDETGLSIDRHSTAMADTESSGLGSNFQFSNPNAVHSDGSITRLQRFPSTASQPEEPILQVKRTPYANGHKSNIDSQIFKPHGSPSNTNPSLASAVFDSNAPASRERVVIDISIAETQSAKPNEDLSIGSDGVRTVRQRISEDLDEESIAQQVQHEIDSQSHRILNKNPPSEGNYVAVEQTILPATKNLENSDLVMLESVSSVATDRDGKEMKRKTSGAQLISPNVTKRRRRRSKSSESLRFTQREQNLPDPSISGRLWRQEHFASRKDFMSPPKEEDQMYFSPKDRVSSPPSQPQDKKSRIGQAESGGIYVDFEDSAIALNYHSPSTKARAGSELDKSVAAVETHKLNSVTAAQASHDGFHNRQTILPAADGEKLDVVMSNTEIQDTREIRAEKPPTSAYTVDLQNIQNSSRPTIFDRFKISYPDYTGTLEQFVNICNKIRNLVESGRGEHQTLWDDFIVRYKTEYPKYINQCVTMAEDPVPYEQFYRNEVLEACYNKLVVTRKTLNEALILRNHVLRSPRPQQAKRIAEDLHVSSSLSIKRPPDSSKGSFRDSRQHSPPTVDLTEESDDSSLVQGPYPLPRSEMKPPRLLPRIETDKPSGSFDRRDVPRRPFAASNVLLSNDSRPEFQSGRPSRLEPASSRDTLGSNPAKITPTSTLFKKPLSDNSQATIESLVSAQPDLIEVAEAKVMTARKMMDAMIDSGIVPESRRATNSPVDVLQESPKGRFPSCEKHNQAQDTSIPVTSDGAESRQGENGPNVANEWRKDENSPFSSFARAYLAIQPGKGNSYAKAKTTSAATEHHTNMGSKEGKSTEYKRFDIFNWYL